MIHNIKMQVPSLEGFIPGMLFTTRAYACYTVIAGPIMFDAVKLDVWTVSRKLPDREHRIWLIHAHATNTVVWVGELWFFMNAAPLSS